MTFLQAHPWTGPDDPSHLNHEFVSEREVVVYICAAIVIALVFCLLDYHEAVWKALPSPVRRLLRNWAFVLLMAAAIVSALVAANWQQIRDAMQPPAERHGNGRTYH